MANGLVERQWPHASKRELPPRTAIAFPIEWCRPIQAPARRPAIGEPKFRTTIASVVDEREELSVGNEMRRDLKRLYVYAVDGTFIVESETGAIMADLPYPVGKREPMQPLIGRTLARLRSHENRPQRVERESVLDVSQQ